MLAVCRNALVETFEVIRHSFEAGGKLLICGNGGSAADAGHIAGELMKGFHLSRPLPGHLSKVLLSDWGEEGRALASALQQGLPVVDLCQSSALLTAVANDNDPALIFAQQVMALGCQGDVLLALSTSGNARNVLKAVKVARSLGLDTICLTGEQGGLIAQVAEIAIKAPEQQTHLVQELHLPLYHALCAMLEEYFFGSLQQANTGEREGQ